MAPHPKAEEQRPEACVEKATEPGWRMSVSGGDVALKAQLEALQCHFTWDLEQSRPELLRLRDKLEDIGTEEGYSWLGHIYNLQGFVQYRLGSADGAWRFFSRAAEAFRQMRNTVSDEGPWLVVNCGNRAWLHYHRGEEAESRACLSKAAALTSEHPPPSPDELHPEVCAEKAWTLMTFSGEQRLQAAGYFQRAVRMRPDVVEWQTSHALAVASALKRGNGNPGADVVNKMRIAREHDPGNLYLAALYLEARATGGQKVEAEARELARGVLKKPVSSYSGIKPLLRLYRVHVSMDEAIDLAEEALERHPGARYLKRCVATCYRMRVFLDRDGPLEHSMVDRAIRLHLEVISLYPDSSLKRKVALADIYAQSDHGQAAADQMYEELLQSDLGPRGTQMLYHHYAKHLQFSRKESRRSIEYHMRAAAIPLQSSHRDNSISILQRIGERNRNRMCGEIREFLANLQN